jgi:hypothetical protein
MPSIQQALERNIIIEIKEKRKNPSSSSDIRSNFFKQSMQEKNDMFCNGRKFQIWYSYQIVISGMLHYFLLRDVPLGARPLLSLSTSLSPSLSVVGGGGVVASLGLPVRVAGLLELAGRRAACVGVVCCWLLWSALWGMHWACLRGCCACTQLVEMYVCAFVAGLWCPRSARPAAPHIAISRGCVLICRFGPFR